MRSSSRKFLNCPGASLHGTTQELALANAKEVIQLWLDTALEFGDPIPRTERAATHACVKEHPHDPE